MSSSLPSTISSDDDYDEELAIEAKRALAYLQTNRKYRYVEFLAQGGYGWVSLVYDDENSRSLAIKCTGDTSEMELSWWPRLDHPNILPLLEHITLDNCTVFIMPAMRKDLWMLVNEPRFYDEELSFGLCRVWLRDMAVALTYLHGQFLCHLDLKLDNVFLKHDGHACLGDFSLLSDIREVPSGMHFLEIYQPPEYSDWCHVTPPESIASTTRFGGDKADIWQYGILTIDLLTNLKLTDSKGSRFTLFHHDIWPFLQKILLHEEYLRYLLEDTFLNVVFKEEDFTQCHDYIKKLLTLEPDSRMSAENSANHAFVNIEWPQLPMEFTLPSVIIEHAKENKPLPIEEIGDPAMTAEEVLAAAQEKEDLLPETPSIGAFDVMKKKIKKMHKEKVIRRESIAVEAGKKLLDTKPAPEAKTIVRQPTAKETSLKAGRTKEKEEIEEGEHVKVWTVMRKTPSGKQTPVKVTEIKKWNTSKKRILVKKNNGSQ